MAKKKKAKAVKKKKPVKKPAAKKAKAKKPAARKAKAKNKAAPPARRKKAARRAIKVPTPPVEKIMADGEPLFTTPIERF